MRGPLFAARTLAATLAALDSCDDRVDGGLARSM
jgi:hypothetical protein